MFNEDISYDDTLKFYQHNTTYVMGPGGKPMATGWTRDGLFGALGLKPINSQIVQEQGMQGVDNRLNVTYLGAGMGGINTGLRAVELIDKSRYVPTDVEIGKAIEEAIKEAAQLRLHPVHPVLLRLRRRLHAVQAVRLERLRRRRRILLRDGYANFSRMYALPHTRAPYGYSIPFINTSNPIIRRADIRRERVWSERGRLKQWQ